MSISKLPRAANFTRLFPLRHDETGKPLCRFCGGPIPKGRRTCCSEACAEEAMVRAGSSAHVRRIVFKRDKGICAICRIDTVAARAAFMELWMVSGRPAKQWMPWESLDAEPVIQARISERLDYWLRRIKPNFGGDFGLYTLYDRKNWWDADHIVPVAEGGGQCGLDNYRTLCLGCHQDVTRDLRERLRKANRAISAQVAS